MRDGKNQKDGFEAFFQKFLQEKSGIVPDGSTLHF